MKSIYIDTEIDLENRFQIGGKAAALGHLLRHGFRVPRFCVISTQVLSRIIELKPGLNAHQHDDQLLQSELLHLPIPETILHELKTALEYVRKSSNALLAVRSSAPVEDGNATSFAGQYETVLGARTDNEIVQALRICWASIASERLASYRNSIGMPPQRAMAVIIQQLVIPSAAGVLFTMNPITRASETIIESTFGFGSLLAHGDIDPDMFVIDCDKDVIASRLLGSKRQMRVLGHDGKLETIDTPTNLRMAYSISDKALLRLAALGNAITSLLGNSQDVEWALSGTTIHILQSRPITTSNRKS